LRRWVEISHQLHAVRFLTWLFLRIKSFDPIVLSLLKNAPDLEEAPSDNRQIYEVQWADWMDMKVHGPTSRWLRSLICDNLRCIPAGAQPRRVLDLGCGEGSTTDCLAMKLGPAEVLGVDRSDPGIQCARARFRRPNLAFTCREDTTGIASESFDLVTCFELLEHVEDWREMTRELARLSQRYVLVSFPTGRMRPFERNVGHLRNFRRGQFERFADSIGLEPVAVLYAGFPCYSPIFREVCNLTNSGGHSLTVGRYSWWQKRTCDMLYFLFRFCSMKQHGDQFCGLFLKRAAQASSSEHS
jgi:SAM-dependent methyltransferase